MTPNRQACAAVLALIFFLSSANLYLLLADSPIPVSAGQVGGIHLRQAAQRGDDQEAGLHERGPPPTSPTRRAASGSALRPPVQSSAPSAKGATVTDDRPAASAVAPPPAPSPSRFMLRPVANAACIEMDDLRKTFDRCETSEGRGGGEPVPTAAAASPLRGTPIPVLARVACPRSLEPDCARGFAAPAAQCLRRTAPLLPALLGWRNVVFAAAVFDDVQTARLIQAAADTWLQMTGGADLFLATDGDDARPDEQIAPITSDSTTVTIHRCPSCRGIRCPPSAAHQTSPAARSTPSAFGRSPGCVGRHEGWLARTKVLDMLGAMAERYLGGGAAPPAPAAKLLCAPAPSAQRKPASQHSGPFIKFDPDTILLPHTLLRLLREIHASVDPLAPLLVGMAACRAYATPPGHTAPLCHAAGGAGYVISPSALHRLHRVAAAIHSAEPAAAAGPSRALPGLFSAVDNVSYGGEDVTVALALKKATGASVVSCGSFYQHNPAKYARMRDKGERWVRWPLSRSPVSFHKFKRPDELRAFFSCALYDRRGRPRPFPRSLLPQEPDNASSAASAAPYRCADPWQTPPR